MLLQIRFAITVAHEIAPIKITKAGKDEEDVWCKLFNHLPTKKTNSGDKIRFENILSITVEEVVSIKSEF